MGSRPLFTMLIIIGGLFLHCGDNSSVKEKWCSYNGASYQPGSTIPAATGCGTCSCFVGGTLTCTDEPCVDGGLGEDLVKDGTLEAAPDTTKPDITVTPDTVKPDMEQPDQTVPAEDS